MCNNHIGEFFLNITQEEPIPMNTEIFWGNIIGAQQGKEAERAKKGMFSETLIKARLDMVR